MKALSHYQIQWVFWLIVALFIGSVILGVMFLGFAFLIGYTFIYLYLTLLTLLIVLSIAAVARRLEYNIRAENIGLHQFNSGEVSSPQELFATGVDRCLEAGIEPKQLLTIIREKYQSVKN